MIIVEIAGFLGGDAEERHTSSGKRVISLRVATRVRKGGKDETVWWRVNIWNDRFDKMLPYLKKGTSLIIIGEMEKPETYVSKDGTTQVSLTLNADIVKFSPFGKPEKSESFSQAPSAHDSMSHTPVHGAAGEASEQQEAFAYAGDDLPF